MMAFARWFLGLSLALAGEYADIAHSDVEKVCSDVGNWQDNQMNDLNNKLVDKFAGEDNEIIKMIIDPNCDVDSFTDSSSECMNDHRSGIIKTAIKAVFPIVLPFLMLLVWLLFFMPCACCRCCRRCPFWCCCREDREARNFGSSKKMVIGIWALLFLVGLVVSAVFAALSADQMKQGNEAAICEVYKFVDSTLNGYTPEADSSDKAFIGMNPAVEQFGVIADTLDQGSPFLTDVEALIGNTKDIENALYEFSSQLTALKTTLADNTDKGSYTCQFCSTSEDVIAGIVNVLDASVAGLLESSRASVKEQLQGTTVVETRDTLESSKTPIQEIGTQVENSLGRIFIDNRETMVDVVDNLALGALIVCITVAIPALLLLTTVGCGAFRSRRETYKDPALRPQNACHASSAWCITCLWSFLVLLLTAIVLLIGFVSASNCIVMQDIDTYINNLVLKTEVDDKTREQMVAIVQNCFGENGSGEFTDSIEVQVGTDSNGIAVIKTLKEALDVSGLVTEPFDSLEEALNSAGSSNLAADPTLTAFFTTAADWAAIYTVADPAQLLSDTSASAADAVVQTFLKLTASCPTTVVTETDLTDALKDGLETSPGTSSGTLNVEGQEYFDTQVTNAGKTLVTGAATQCHSVADFVTSGDATEESYRQLAKKAAEVREDTTFQCTTVTFNTNTDGYSVETSTTAACGGTGSFTDYQTHITTVVAALQTAVGAIDTAAGNTQTQIDIDMRALVNQYFVDPMDVIVDGINCQFLGTRWNEMVDALCITAIPGLMATGFCWLAMGVIAWAVILMEFSIWRRLKDNVSLWQDEVNRQRR